MMLDFYACTILHNHAADMKESVILFPYEPIGKHLMEIM